MRTTSGKLSFRKFIPAIIWFFIVLFLLCLPGDEVPDMDSWFHLLHMDKAIHFSIFGVMAFLFMAPPGMADFPAEKKMITFIAIGAAVCLWGLATEFIQKYYVPGRSFELTDWISDTCGSFVAVLIARIRFRN